jgi:hypothetical protein
MILSNHAQRIIGVTGWTQLHLQRVRRRTVGAVNEFSRVHGVAHHRSH